MCGDPSVGVECVQAVRGEHHRCATTRCDPVQLKGVPVRVERIAGFVGDVRTGDEGVAVPGGGGQHLGLRGVVEQLHIAGVHVDGRGEPRSGCPLDVCGEAGPVDPAVVGVRQQGRRHAGDRATRPDHGARVGRFAHRSSPPVRRRRNASASASGTTASTTRSRSLSRRSNAPGGGSGASSQAVEP